MAEGLTKHVDRSNLDKNMNECGFAFRVGRHELCPFLGDVEVVGQAQLVQCVFFPFAAMACARTSMAQLELTLDPDQYWIKRGFNLDLNCDQTWTRINLGVGYNLGLAAIGAIWGSILCSVHRVGVVQ